MPTRPLALALPVALLTTGCASQVAVSFHGNVVAARVPGAAYEDTPASGEPVASAVVRVCRCVAACVCERADALRSVQADATGRYAVPTIVLEDRVGLDNIFVLVAEAPGFAPVTYSTNYDRPTEAERAARDHATPLNFRMKRNAPAPVGWSPRLDALLSVVLEQTEATAPRRGTTGPLLHDPHPGRVLEEIAARDRVPEPDH